MTHKTILTIIGFYYIVTGVWPIMHMTSFEKITGPKRDHWLVKTVSLLIISSGVIFLYPWLRMQDATPEIILLAKLNAASLFIISLVYSLKNIISKIYLADAILEFSFLMLLLIY